jgi:DNA-directed RNA polymerase specialized sigma24 family protein
MSDPKHSPGVRGAGGYRMASDERPEFRTAAGLFAAYLRQHGIKAQCIEDAGGGHATAESLEHSQATRAVLPAAVQAAMLSIPAGRRERVVAALRWAFVVGLRQSSIADRMHCDARSVDRYVSAGLGAIKREAIARGLMMREDS